MNIRVYLFIMLYLQQSPRASFSFARVTRRAWILCRPPQSLAFIFSKTLIPSLRFASNTSLAKSATVTLHRRIRSR